MAADETRVLYRAVANFLQVKKAARDLKKDLREIRAEEKKTNDASVAGAKRVSTAQAAAAKALRSRTTATKTATAAILAHNKALAEQEKLLKRSNSTAQNALNQTRQSAAAHNAAAKAASDNASATNAVASASNTASNVSKSLQNAISNTAKSSSRAATVLNRHRAALAGLNKDGGAFIPLSGRIANGGQRILNVFTKLGRWRPRMTPPFVALIPLIGGLLALLNPLVATLSAVSAAAFAGGSSLLSLGGAAVAIVPMISAAVAAVASLIVAFNGIGGVFGKWKAFRDLQQGGGGGGGGKSAADQAWDLMLAQERLADSMERVTDAQEDLNDARELAVRRLEDLRRAVARASIDEAQAAANAQQAMENYYNIMADPGSTAGEKAAALADLQDAQQAVIDQQVEATRNQEDLNDAEAKGVEGSDEVVQAQRNLRDALRASRDAAHALQKTMEGSGGGGGVAGAMDEFQKALEKLSPSAQKVVLALIAMGPAWEAVQRSVQEAFFSEVVDDMDNLAGLLPTIENLLGKAASAMGRFASAFIRMVSSPEWKDDFGLISDVNVALIDQAGRAVLALSTAWKDLIIAAGPFAEDLLSSFANLSESFSRIVADARESGSLATWLDLVYTRLQQWWRIIKNVAQTLWNYGAAAGEFGKWITDGLEQMTANWLKSSEEARRNDSPFKAWLEDIKPLLSTVKGLFGDFFSWLRSTSMDETVIGEAISILETIRTELGPALSSLFDSLTSSGIGTDFVESLSSIVKSLAEIIAAGGDEGLKTFFDIVSGFFSFIADLFKDPVWGPAITILSQFAGAMAALSFIGTFTGLFTFFGWLVSLAKNGAVMLLLSKLGGLSGLGGAAAGTVTSAAGTSVVTGAAGATAATGAAAGGGILAGAKGALGGVAKGGLVGLIIAGLIQAIGSGAKVVGSGVSNISDAASGKQTWEQASDNMRHDQAAAMGPPGVGVLTGLIDSIFGTTINEGWADLMDGLHEIFEDVWSNVGDWFNENLIVPVSKWFFDNVITPFNTFITGLMTWWTTNIGQPLAELWQTIQDIWNLRILPAWDLLMGWVQENIFTPIANAWNGMVAWVQNTIFAPIAGAFQAVANWIQLYVFKPIGDAFRFVATWVQTNVFTPIKGFFSTVATWVQTNVFTPIKTAFTTVTSWIQTSIFTPIKNSFDWVIGQINSAFSAIRNFNPITAFNNWLRNTFALPGAKGGKAAIGGLVKATQYLASGGNVRRVGDPRYNMDPKGTDTVPAMLTPDEYVVKRERVREVGAENMEAFNDGILSFAGLLSKTKAGKGQSGVGYFDGGGLVGTRAPSSVNISPSDLQSFGKTMVDNSMHFGDIHIHNPKPERSSESLPRAIRAAAYQGGRRKPSKRLEKVNA